MLASVVPSGVQNTGSLLLNAGSILTGNKGTFGGAISAVEEARVAMHNSTISNCTATQGGGVYTMNVVSLYVDGQSVIRGCSADYGGGIAATLQTTITLASATFTGNFAKGMQFVPQQWDLVCPAHAQ